MVLLCTTAGTELFKQFVLQVMSYPNGYIVSDVPWGLDRVRADSLDCDALKKDNALVVFVDYYEDPESLAPRASYRPLREAKIVNARNYAGKLLLDLRMGGFVYYSPDVERGYPAGGSAGSTAALPAEQLRWNQRIGAEDDIPQAIATDPGKPMKYKDFGSWKSGGLFVLRLKDTPGMPPVDFLIVGDKSRDGIRDQHDDWKGVIDRIAGSYQMKDKLFYQVELKKTRSNGTRDFPTTFGGKTVYRLSSGDYAQLVVHFYFGAGVGHRDLSQMLLEVSTDPAYLSTVGNALIQVYPDQAAGKVETLELIVKRQLSEEFTRVRIQQQIAIASGAASLATVELYLRIIPRRLYIWILVALFFAGSFLDAVPEDLGGPGFKVGWGAKLLGSAMMAGAFWLGFSKLPSKGE